MKVQKPYVTGAMAATLYHSTKSLMFDGLTDLAVNFNLFGISTFVIRNYNRVTVSMWVKSTKALAPNNAHQTIIGRWFPTVGGGIAANEGGWRWMINDIASGPGTRPLHFHVCTHFLNGLWIYSNTDFPLDEWVHVVMTYDGSGAVAGLKMYWNGVQQAVTTLGGSTWTTSAVNSNAYSHLLWGTQYTAWPTGFGGPSVWPPVLTWYFEGLIDESCLWRTDLSPADVWGLYNKGKPVSPLHVGLPNRADRYYRMGEVSDGAPWLFGYSIAQGRIPVGGTITNMFWNNDGFSPPVRVSMDVAA